jgi:hypothetical protein
MASTIMTMTLGRHADLDLHFALEKTPIADLWLAKMASRHQWPLDHPDRFYGFDDREVEQQRALQQVRQCVDTINGFRRVIDRQLHSVQDQDTLNYLHHIFEIYHGQLDQQTHELWQQAPIEVRKSLAELNLAVHRCESLRNGTTQPRLVCTWYGMPKKEKLALSLQQDHARDASEFGGVYLNYVEIGKTVLEMAQDNDTYMADTMFQPFTHYSADFRVDFFDDSPDRVTLLRKKTTDFFCQHQDYFLRAGIDTADDVRIRPTKFKVAQLLYESADKDRILKLIRDRQWVESVTIT